MTEPNRSIYINEFLLIIAQASRQLVHTIQHCEKIMHIIQYFAAFFMFNINQFVCIPLTECCWNSHHSCCPDKTLFSSQQSPKKNLCRYASQDFLVRMTLFFQPWLPLQLVISFFIIYFFKWCIMKKSYENKKLLNEDLPYIPL